eukprot:Rmarinus@m.23768
MTQGAWPSGKAVPIPSLPGCSYEPKREHYGRPQIFGGARGDISERPALQGRWKQSTSPIAYLSEKEKGEKQQQPESARNPLNAWGAHDDVGSRVATPRSSDAYGSHFKPDSGTKKNPTTPRLDDPPLVFNGYLQENLENDIIVRSCAIHYFEVDGTFEVLERRKDNTGTVQGRLLKRTRVPKNKASGVFGEGPTYLALTDVTVPGDLTLFGRTYRIVSCDERTREVLFKAGVPVGPEEDYPEDYYKVRREMSEYKQPRFDDMRQYLLQKMGVAPRRMKDCTKFIKYDRCVLRFFGILEDAVSRRKVYLRYYLAYDTIEVVEQRPRVDGSGPRKVRDAESFLLIQKATRVPKDFDVKSQDLRPSLVEPRPDEFLSDADLTVGETVNVFGRKIFLYDCDDFTKSYYEDVYGVTFHAVEVPDDTPKRPEIEPPPYDGFGDEADTLRNVDSLHPRAKQTDFRQYVEKASIELRFRFRMVSRLPEDKGRKFVASFFPMDSTMKMSELQIPNSGRQGGKFLARMQVKKPRSREIYEVKDLKPGSTVCVYGYTFVVEDADEFTRKYLGLPPAISQFIPRDDHEDSVGDIAGGVSGYEGKSVQAKRDRSGVGAKSAILAANTDAPLRRPKTHGDVSTRGGRTVSFADADEPDDVAEALNDVSVSACRGREEDNEKDLAKRLLWRLRDEFESRGVDLRVAFRLMDRDRSGWVAPEDIRDLLDAYGIQVGIKEFLDLVKFFDPNGDGKIDHHEFLDALRPVPVKAPAPAHDAPHRQSPSSPKDSLVDTDYHNDYEAWDGKVRSALGALPGMQGPPPPLPRPTQASQQRGVSVNPSPSQPMSSRHRRNESGLVLA